MAHAVYEKEALVDYPTWHKYIAAGTTISGQEGATIAYASNGTVTVASGATISSTAMVTAKAYGHLVNAVVVLSAQPTEEKYNPEFVRKILEADARPPAAKFTNVVDMMEWLDRD